jgi:hypothetical protein
VVDAAHPAKWVDRPLPGAHIFCQHDVRTFCQGRVAEPEYRTNFEQRWRNGTLPPALEQMVWGYAIGKPQQSFR